MDQQPSVDDLFPPPSTDELFPADIEKQRYRRQTLGTSPIQDLIFGDTSVNPVARVLDHFSQGVRQIWGATDATRLSKESEDFLKVNKQFDTWNQGQNSLVKAANESLFRPAAVQMVKEFHDAEALYRGVGAVIHGGQEAVAQIGEELSGTAIDTGLKTATGVLGTEVGTAKVGREIAGAVEALPTGFHAPTGIPHAPPHPALVEARNLQAEIARARELGVIGAGEDGYFGINIRPIEPTPPISGPQEAAKPAGMPVDLFIDPRAPEAKPAETAPTPGLPVAEAKPVEPTAPEATAPNPIVEDVTQKLIAVGRPEAEARASAELIASHYAARAERFNGERGTAEQLYAAEGPDIRGEGGVAPSRSEPIKPGEPQQEVPPGEQAKPSEPIWYQGVWHGAGDKPVSDYWTTDLEKAREYSGPGGQVFAAKESAFSPEALATRQGNVLSNKKFTLGEPYQIPDVETIGKFPREGGAAEPIKTVPELKKALRGRAAADPQTWSLYEFLAKEGGLKPTADLKSIFGGKNPFVPGFGPLLRESGLTMDEALTRAKENAYILDPNDIQHVPGAANTGELTKSVNDLHDMIAEESRGRKNYRTDHTPKEKAINPEEERTSILDDLHRQINAAGDQVVPGLEDRTVEIVQKEGMDVHSAYERAIMEDHDANEALLNDRRAIKETANIRGHDAPDRGAAPHSLQEFIDDSGYTWASEQEASRAHVEAASGHGAHDRASREELEFFQKVYQPKPGETVPYDELRAAGFDTETKLYHQTSKENAASIRKSGFDISDARARARLSDEGVPNGVFLKPHSKDIGVGAVKDAEQMPIFIRRGNQKVFSDRGTLSAFLDNDKRYAQLADEAKVWDREQAAIFRKQFEEGPRRGRGMFNEDHEGQADAFLKAWEAGNAERATAARARATEVFKDAGIETVVIKRDEGSLGRSTETVIAVGGNQIADAIPATWGETAGRLLFQIKRGKINLRNDAKPIITLFKDANASTFIHETGHQWLEELMKDAEHPLAPAELKADASKVLDWLGVDNADAIKTSHHEKFARGFERYMMEGKAPNQALANVFYHFKAWLTKIYQTVTRLKSPINDEIRGVFDRLLTMHPSEVKIEPEGPPKTFADIHEADAISATPETARPVAETIQAERDMLANEHIPEEHDARLEGIASGTSRREARGPQPLRDGHEAGLGPAEAGNDQAAGAVGAGGSSAASEGARASVGGGKTEPPVSPQASFTGPESPLVDKAGNIRLDNLGTAEDVNKAIRDAAAENNEFIDARRGVVTDGQVLELADALGMDAGQLNTRKLGQAYNAEQIMAARKLLIQSATTVRDAMVKAAAGSEADILAYAEAKSRHQMIQEQVAGITAEAGRALRAFRKLEGQQEAGQIDAFLKDATGKTLFQLQQEAKLGSQLPTPADVSRFVSDSSKPTWKDKVIELWMSFLLSGPKTHAANMIGNTISGLLRPVETAMSAGYGKLFSTFTTQERVLFGEAKAELFGAFQGSREGVVAAYKAFKTEEPQLTSVNQIERGHQKALPEIGGKQLRIPLRLLGAEDEFFKATSFRGSINRQAYAIAAKENLPPEKFNARVAELSVSPTEEMVSNAKDAADYLAFQKPLGESGRKAQLFINSHVALKFIVPFVRTPVNLLKYAGERTPLGVFSREVRDNLSGKNGPVARDTQLARVTLGTMVGVATFSLANEGLITGGGPSDPKQRAVMQAEGWQPYSVKIGGMYYAYNRLDPFSIIMGVVADAHEIYTASSSEHPEKEHLASLIFAAVTKNITDRASLKGPSDLIQAVTNNERYGKSYINGMVGTVIPAFLAQTAQAIDPTVREARTVIDYLKSRTPYLSETLHPKRDVWGEPIVREGGFGPDIGSPIMERRLKNDPVNQALLAAHYYPAKLDRKIRGVELTDQQYDDYSRVAGRMAKVRLNAMANIIGNPNIPEAVRHDMIQNVIKASRDSAGSLIIMQNPDIMKKAADAKLGKLRAH